MLRSANELKNYILLAKDGEIGRSKDFLFDDRTWTVRYMVADTAKWLPGRKVLISPVSLGIPDWGSNKFPVELTRKAIKNSPNLDEHAPVSRRFEIEYHRHFEVPVYWHSPGAWPQPKPVDFIEREHEKLEASDEDADNQHLRSVHEVTHYDVRNDTEFIGDIDDFIVDDGSWGIRYLVIDTGHWLPGRKVLIAPDWIQKINFSAKKVTLWLSREEVKASPPYDPAAPINRKYEEVLYDFYGRPTYWGEPGMVHTASH